MNRSEEQRLIETVEELEGKRSTRRRRAAVRIEDLEGLMKIPNRLQATKAAGSTPTQAEFDALLADVEFMRLRFNEVMEALQKRLLP